VETQTHLIPAPLIPVDNLNVFPWTGPIEHFSNLSLKNFYSIADLLLKHKDSIEAALFEKEKNVFDLEQVVTLYDITNTYFEGREMIGFALRLTTI
jgi:hypothetical protein